MRARFYVAIAAMLASSACSHMPWYTPDPRLGGVPDPADTGAIKQVAKDIMRGLAEGDTAIWNRQYFEQAVRIGDDEIVRGSKAIKASIELAASKRKDHITITLGDPSVRMLGKNYALYYVPFLSSWGGGRESSEAHGALTLVLVRDHDEWRVLHEHSSVE